MRNLTIDMNIKCGTGKCYSAEVLKGHTHMKHIFSSDLKEIEEKRNFLKH